MAWLGSCPPPAAVDNSLSTRETQILRLVAAGLTTKAIAATLSIAQSTVNWHIGNVLAKLGASSRAEAVAIMLRDGPPLEPVVVVRPARSARARRLAAIAASLAILFALAGASAVAAFRRSEPDRPARPAVDVTPRPTALITASPQLDGGRAPATESPTRQSPAGSPLNVRSPAAPAAPAVVRPAPFVPVPLPTIPAVSAPPLPSLPAIVVPLPPLPSALPQLPSIRP